MPYVTVDKENSGNVDLYYEDHGEGQPVVLVHGFPLNGASWEKQTSALLQSGYRVITYDRRGFGKSSQPSTGYDYDVLSSDLKVLVDTLALRDVVLAGFSMGCGEVIRYLSLYGADRVQKMALFSPIAPYLLQTDDNPEGVPAKIFDDIKDSIQRDRFTFLKGFFSDFYNVDVHGGNRISDEALLNSWNIGAMASASATLQCVDAWCTDFRGDLDSLWSVPKLLIQGTEDRITPIDNTGRRLASMMSDIDYYEIENGPHNIAWTHSDEVNRHFLNFLSQ